MRYTVGTSLQNGKYILTQELGVGGFGRTYKAINQILNQVVVIKTFKSVLSQQEDLAERRKELLNEAQRLIKCYHPNIVRFYEFFIEAEIPYIVMDYIPGETLDKIVLPESPLTEATAIDYIRQLGAALRVVHNNGLLHRDIKPQNLMLHQDSQQVVLIDFGIAREFNQGRVQTHTSIVSDGYAPIEQYLPKAARTTATDIYGLAATLYTLVTAEIPIPAPLRNRMPLSTPKEIRSELSESISEAIMQGMALEKEERPSNIDEWLSLLPQQESKITSESSEKVVLMGRESQPKKLAELPQAKKSSNRKQVLVWLSVLAAIGWGLDYAWLKFQSFSSQKKIPLNSSEKISPMDSLPVVNTPQVEPIVPQDTKSEKSQPAPKAVVQPVVSPPKVKPITPQETKPQKYQPAPKSVVQPVVSPPKVEPITPQETKPQKSQPAPKAIVQPVVSPPKVKPITPQETKPVNSTPVPTIVYSDSEQVTPPKNSSVNSTPVPTIVYSDSEQVAPPQNSSLNSETNSRPSGVEIEDRPNNVNKIENGQIRVIRTRREQITRKRTRIIRKKE